MSIQRKFLNKYYFAILLCIFIFSIDQINAQNYPEKPIKIIVSVEPGSVGDLAVRPIAEELQKILKVPVVIINKPGASSTLGTDFVVKSKRDGYTLLYTPSSSIVYAKASNPDQVPYDPLNDLEPLGLHFFFPTCLAVQESSPLRTFSNLINFAKENPGVLKMGVHGLGTLAHFNVEIIQSITGSKFTIVPFKGAPTVITSLLGGHIDSTLIATSLISPHYKAGKLRMLLMAKKVAEFPEVPTLKELGYDSELLISWFAFFAPSGVSEEVKKTIIPALEKAIKKPELLTSMEKLGTIVDFRSPNEIRKLILREYEIARTLAIKLGFSK